MKNKEILNLEFHSEDLNENVTIREYFYKLMEAFWNEKENFSPKRPLGNSDWDGDIILCLIKNKLVEGSIDENGWLDDYDYEKVDKFILKRIIKPIFSI